MAQQIIDNLEGGTAVRTALNAMFAELYGSLTFPTKLGVLSANAEQPIPSNTVIQFIFINPVSGSPVLDIGTTANGGEVFPSAIITGFTPITSFDMLNRTGISNLFFTLTGGQVEITIVTIPNIF